MMISIFFSNKAFLIKIQRKTQKTEFIYKKWCIYFYMFKLQSPSKFSPFDAMHLLRLFFHCLKQFLNLSILMPFSTCAIFFHLFYIGKTFSFVDTFHLGKQTKKMSLRVRSSEYGEWSMGSCHFWSKTAEHSAWCGQMHS